MNKLYPKEIKIIRVNEAANLLGMSKSSFLVRVKQGLLPSSISLGIRSVGWVEGEVKTVLRAMVRGENPENIKRIVVAIIKQRQYLV